MDASELDLDARLYKASGTLLKELQNKLPQLLYHPNLQPRRHRLRVLYTKYAELTFALDRFQEWPQLLDTCLASLIQLLADAFLDYLVKCRSQYGTPVTLNAAGSIPLPRAICGLLYAFCKVRGYKVIVRLLNNEAKYLAPMLSAFRDWNNPETGMTWEERYIMLLWLSHLMLAPFELAHISAGKDVQPSVPELAHLHELTGMAGNIVVLGFEQLRSPAKEREAASIMLVRLTLRADMQVDNLLGQLVAATSQQLLSNPGLVVKPYVALGHLSLLFGIVNSATDDEIAPHIRPVFTTIQQIASDRTQQSSSIREFAPARKYFVKTLRATVLHAMSLSSKDHSHAQHKHGVDEMVEESIQYYLESLYDKDTPVRVAAAKALSMVTLKLDPAMSVDVVQAVLESLQENVLLEDTSSGRLVAITDDLPAQTTAMKRNLSAVDLNRWHGLMLTLAQLLFRRSPPASMMPEIIQALMLGLDFEQRSNVGTSLGVGVRDAACFGIWALARNYTTAELEFVSTSLFPAADRVGLTEHDSVLQLLAVKLTISACLDPSGNLRRGSSAALQEIIGRHPDTIVQGIPVVQVVDYHAVARLSRSIKEVAPGAAALDSVYDESLLAAMLGWRGLRAADANQRRWAAEAISMLTTKSSSTSVMKTVDAIQQQVLQLKPANVGSTAATRHGLLLGLAAAIRSSRFTDAKSTLDYVEAGFIRAPNLDYLTGNLTGRVTSDLELAMEGTAVLIGEICKCLPRRLSEARSTEQSLVSATRILDHCVVASQRDIVIQSSATAFVELISMFDTPKRSAVINDLLENKKQKSAAATSRGRLTTLSLMHEYLARAGSEPEIRWNILLYVMGIADGPHKIEARVDAMQALGSILRNISLEHNREATAQILKTLKHGLTDYTNDQRGDIGSTLRLQTLDTLDSVQAQEGYESLVNGLMPIVVRLAAEKLNNVRFRAWKCLENRSLVDTSLRPFESTVHFVTDVSSEAYFHQLMKLMPLTWAQQDLILGLVSSATSGSEEICRAASTAFVQYVQSSDVVVRTDMLTKTSLTIMQGIASHSTEEDRHVVPLLDFLSFLIDQRLFIDDQSIPNAHRPSGDLWSVIQSAHASAASIQRVEACLNVYARLLSIDAYRARALDRLTRLLLHRWPKIRNAAADMLFLEQQSETMARADWNAPVAKIKPVVLQLRKELGVSNLPVGAAK